ncbi:MAG: pseudouridine synthase, partial [Flavobacteriales bacterium]|nr:pseudouridine synthase [Flavobacteriales bacterium]
FRMLSRFTKDGKKPLLGELGHFEPDVYPVGRLDADSEGLLILTNNKALTNALLKPVNAHKRVYYAQVDRIITPEAAKALEKGVDISLKGVIYRTRPAKAELIDPPVLPERHPPVRYRADIPTSWVKLELIEGKNRQVRRMTAAVGFPTLRLVRYAIEDLTIDEMISGDVVELSETEIRKKLHVVL